MFLIQAIQRNTPSPAALENKTINLLSMLSQEIPKTSSVISDNKLNPLRLRKVKSSFSELHSMLIDRISSNRTADTKTSEGPPTPDDNQLEWMLCYAIFDFITSGMVTANTILDQLESDLKLKHSQALIVAKLRINLCRHLLLVHRMKLCEYRQALWRNVHRFPDESVFNRLLIDVENKGFTSLKIRRFYQLAVQNAKSIHPLLFAITFELKRLKSLREAYTNEQVVVSGLGTPESTQVRDKIDYN